MERTPEERAARLKAAEKLQQEAFHFAMGAFDGINDGGLGAIPGLLDRMEETMARFGLPDMGLSQHLADLRQVAGASLRRVQVLAAAEWAGDLDRMRALQDQPWPDTRHLLKVPGAPNLVFDEDEACGADWDHQDAVLPDAYEDLAQGVPGALEALIASGQDLNLRLGFEDRTAFQAALEAPGRRVEHLERLIAAGADPALPGPMGDDVIYSAVGYRHRDSVTMDSERQVFGLLFRSGSTPNAASEAYGTPLLASILLGSPVEIALLLDAGARLDAVMPARYHSHGLAGYTALMLAAPKPDVFRLLLDHGADPSLAGLGGEPLSAFLNRAIAEAGPLAEDDDWFRAHVGTLARSRKILEKA